MRDVLTEIESYADERLFFAQSTFELEILPLYFESAQLLDQLVKIRSKIANEQQTNNNENFSSLLNLIITIGIIIVLGTLLIAIFTTLSITKPVQRLKVILLELGKGVFPKKESLIISGNQRITNIQT